MAYGWLRATTFINRFATLRKTDRAFAGLPAGSVVRRRLFGHDIEIDLSRSQAQQLLFVEGERFVDERFLLKKLLLPGMTVVDVGANIGYYLLLFQQAIGSRGRVICIEPSVENLPELRRNIELNRFENLELHAVALGDHEGETGLRSGINSGVVEAESGAYHVPLRRLDRLISEPVDFLKIDVEGYEGQVLAGAVDLLQRDKPTIFLELHPHIVGRFGYSVRRILDSLKLIYPSIGLYEKVDDSGLSLSQKIAVRYFGRDPMRAVADPDAYVERYDRGDVSHTYWAVCKA